jgi:RimJ/RimL family protein N-acetyltransferase
MNYADFIKKFSLQDFKAPEKLHFDDLVAKPLTRGDLKVDLEAINSSIETIQKTRGGSWPQEELNEELDFLDLAWHEREFREGTSFAYVIYDTNGNYIGCFYLYPMGHRTVLTEELLGYDVDASWWVTTAAYGQGYYQKLHKALKQWLAMEFPFKNIYYSNKEIPL